MDTSLFLVDAFTDQPFSGNPACVCLVSEPRDHDWMQKVAFEMNLSETAFVLEKEDGFSLRWFTPTTEVDICGHATLAAAHILWETGTLKPTEEIPFHTRSGILPCNKEGNKIHMGFPAMYSRPDEFSPELLNVFKINPLYVGKFGEKQLIEVENEDIVRSLNPDYEKLCALHERGIVITAASDSPEYDFISRYFAPWVGVNEDPVTGTSHCCLATYWGKRLKKQELRAYQASKRGGFLSLRIQGEQVILGGEAVTIVEGTLKV